MSAGGEPAVADALDDLYRRADALLAMDGMREPLAVADALRPFVAGYRALSPEGREALRAVLTEAELTKLASFSVCAAIRAEGEHDPEGLREALLLHDLEGFRGDPRDNFRMLAVPFDVAKTLGEDPDALFRASAASMDPGAARYVEQFVALSAGAKSLRGMRVRKGVTSSGRVEFTFE